MKSGPNGRQGHLFLVMEYGEIDLARLLAEQQKEPMNMAWIAYYWQQVGNDFVDCRGSTDRQHRCSKPSKSCMTRRSCTPT